MVYNRTLIISPPVRSATGPRLGPGVPSCVFASFLPDHPSSTITMKRPRDFASILPRGVSVLFAFSVVILTIAIFSDRVASADKPVFADDFEQGMNHWETLDPQTWPHASRDGSKVIEITDRKSAYAPPVRSPLHVALIKGVELGSFELEFRVKSTKDTGNHRDCCVFFNYLDDQHFYYVHLGAKPDPHSGQIMIVNEAPRLALTKNEKNTPWDDQWHHVKLVRDVQAGLIAIYFDDMETPHMQVVDKTFTTGRIGLGSFDDLNAFDDVVIVAK